MLVASPHPSGVLGCHQTSDGYHALGDQPPSVGAPQLRLVGDLPGGRRDPPPSRPDLGRGERARPTSAALRAAAVAAAATLTLSACSTADEPGTDDDNLEQPAEEVAEPEGGATSEQEAAPALDPEPQEEVEDGGAVEAFGMTIIEDPRFAILILAPGRATLMGEILAPRGDQLLAVRVLDEPEARTGLVPSFDELLEQSLEDITELESGELPAGLAVDLMNPGFTVALLGFERGAFPLDREVDVVLGFAESLRQDGFSEEEIEEMLEELGLQGRRQRHQAPRAAGFSVPLSLHPRPRQDDNLRRRPRHVRDLARPGLR